MNKFCWQFTPAFSLDPPSTHYLQVVRRIDGKQNEYMAEILDEVAADYYGNYYGEEWHVDWASSPAAAVDTLITAIEGIQSCDANDPPDMVGHLKWLHENRNMVVSDYERNS